MAIHRPDDRVKKQHVEKSLQNLVRCSAAILPDDVHHKIDAIKLLLGISPDMIELTAGGKKILNHQAAMYKRLSATKIARNEIELPIQSCDSAMGHLKPERLA